MTEDPNVTIIDYSKLVVVDVSLDGSHSLCKLCDRLMTSPGCLMPIISWYCGILTLVKKMVI